MLTIDEECGEVRVRGADGVVRRHDLATPEAFEAVSAAWLRCGWDVKYVYSFTWLGRPVIQLPEDLIRMQELIWRIRPDVIVETGVAHGGSLVFYASLFAAIGHGRQATLTAVVPPARFGALALDGARVTAFTEKPPGDNAFINGGFFVLHPDVLARIEGDATPWEREPLESLARDGELQAFRHTGFWHAMDTLRDRTHLEALWQSGRAPWLQ